MGVTGTPHDSIGCWHPLSTISTARESRNPIDDVLLGSTAGGRPEASAIAIILVLSNHVVRVESCVAVRCFHDMFLTEAPVQTPSEAHQSGIAQGAKYLFSLPMLFLLT